MNRIAIDKTNVASNVIPAITGWIFDIALPVSPEY